ncbi:FtsX-like permease family protein [Duganella sp. Root1480D1]|uniref:FtsX-like permease family protein n=1 Tax=Duganella sp. Root1480D1 TaxID=1736471 RepID=UPI00070A07CD|nr:FtsX-like permease family protein [Duganella sp. Root1480D1]KQZ39792.1 cell division protein FtsX [Duganella sp. Root1480D1]
MIFRDFRIGWRTLMQEPVYSLVAIAGLGIGLAVAVLLFGFVRHSTQYNVHIPNVERTYILKQQLNMHAGAPVYDTAPLMLRKAALALPGVEAATAFVPARPAVAPLALRVNDRLVRLNALLVMPGFTRMLGLRALRGDLEHALEAPEGLVLTESAAQRMFGEQEALGQTAVLAGPKPKQLRVMAVVRDQPANTTIPFEALAGSHTHLADRVMQEEMQDGARGWGGRILVRVRQEASLPAIVGALQAAVEDSPMAREMTPEARQALGGRHAIAVSLFPMRDAYFDDQVVGDQVWARGDRGNPAAIAALAAVAVLVLLLASVNYVNLTVVRVIRRQREIGVCKVLGASTRQVVLQMLAESLLVCLLATVLGLVLAWLLLPAFSGLMQRDLAALLSPVTVCYALALGLAIGFLTALYPAWIAIRARPAQALGGRPDAEPVGGGYLRRALTVFQMASAMGLAAVALAVAWQTQFAMTVSPGFDPAPILIVNTPGPARQDPDVRAFMAELEAQPGIAGIAVSDDPATADQGMWSATLRRPSGTNAAVAIKSVGNDFFRSYQINPVAGRLFERSRDKDDDPSLVVLNSLAARALGFATDAEAIGQTVEMVTPEATIRKQVIGIAPQIRYRSLREQPGPLAYELWTASVTLNIRTSGDIRAAELQVRQLWSKYFPDDMLEVRSASQVMADSYAEDARMAKLLGLATAIALAIAAFGTYVLAAYAVQRRSKEIVLRKLHGASPRDIGWLVAREAGALVLAAAVIAIPLAGVAIERYLAGFVERAPIAWWTLPGALAATAIVAAAAVARHAWIAMCMHPASALQSA